MSWLERRAAATPDALACAFGREAISYGALRDRARRLASVLRAVGVERGDVVAVLLENEPSYVVLLHALDAIGAVLLPLSWRLTPAELSHPLRDSHARVLLHGSGELTRLARAASADLPETTPIAVDALLAGADFSLPRRTCDRQPLDPDTLLLLYTSGTTGAPKGAMLGRSALAASARGAEALLGASEPDRWLLCMPLFHVGGLSILIRACLAGASAVVHARFDPAVVARALDEDGITAVSLVPAMLERLLEVRGDRVSPSGLRLLLLGGAPASIALLERARSLGYPVAPTYGLTEAASQVATRPPGDEMPPLDGRLQPLPGTTVRIVDDEGRTLGPGEAGEICVHGPTLMSGYVDQPEATARALQDGWLQTGDVGVLDSNGLLRILDRRDDLIVSGGENVYPAEIEGVLCQHPDIVEAAVIARVDARFGARPMAYIVTRGAEIESEALAAFCRKHLAAYKVPVAFQRIDLMPRNAAGKLLRRQLRGGA
jgi:O-succinylbenzoic acid--CoA ligase